MARITEAEKKLTPIYFQVRRESKFTIPPVALPAYELTHSELVEEKEFLDNGNVY